MYQLYILSGFRPKNLLCAQISWEFGNFNYQNNKFKQKCLFEILCNKNEWYDMYHIAKVYTTGISRYDTEP